MARDIFGEQVFDPTSDKAVRWCLMGVFHMMDAEDNTFRFLRRTLAIEGFNDPDRFNDETNYDRVLDYLVFVLKRYFRLSAKDIVKFAEVMEKDRGEMAGGFISA